MEKLTNPIVVADTGWAETLPNWLFSDIQAERLINGMCELLGKKSLDYKESVGDSEVLAYLCSASSRGILDTHYTNIYMYLTKKVMLKLKRITEENIKEFDFLDVDKLSEYEEVLLNDLKRHLFNSRGGKIKHPILEFLKEFQKEVKADKNLSCYIKNE